MQCREFIVRIPLIGGIAYCRLSDLIKTLDEIIPKFAIAALPIVMSTILLRYSGNHIQMPLALTSNFANGELYLFCSSMLSSIFYIAVKDRSEDKPGFPNRQTHLLFVVLMIAISAFIYGLKRAGLLIDAELLLDVSYWFFGLSFLMVILATTINNGLNSNNPITFQKAQTDDFFKELEKHRG